MRLQLFIVLLFSFSVCEAQIEVNLQFRDGCKGELIEVDYELSQLKTEKFYKSHNGIISLPSGGLYLLSAVFNRGSNQGVYVTNVLIKENNVFRDTISIPKLLQELPTLHQKKTNYLTCTGVAEGNYSEYYDNGVKRLEGFFNHGLANGFVVTYDNKGNKKSKLKYRKGYLIRSKYY
ncbi:hypothetical protein HRH25_23690 [Flavisolibacter sp. BT320]|nr:hypothetical protein [Flavisolibacter longurius]